MEKNKITLVYIKKDTELCNFILEKLKEEYLFSFMTCKEFSKKYSISYDAIKYVLKINNLSKDRSKYCSAKRGC